MSVRSHVVVSLRVQGMSKKGRERWVEQDRAFLACVACVQERACVYMYACVHVYGGWDACGGKTCVHVCERERGKNDVAMRLKVYTALLQIRC